MPRGDGTGPQGQGSKTGRGLGPCGSGTEEVVNSGEKMGFFQRLGRGLGFGQSGQGRGTGRGRNR
ncbi:MAG: DUF5320 domain-containing protein [Syntrophobacterales bacterium]|nr:DUF5320 domain-containing protein [Syntrophobacterales bacterium]